MPPNVPPPLLEALELTRSAPSSANLLLDRVSLRVEASQRWGVVGPTGAGKSLLLRSLALLDSVDSGEVRWRGEAIANADVPGFRRNVVFLHQRPALIDASVAENLKLPFAFNTSRQAGFDRDFVEQHLVGVGRTAAFLDRQAEQLSGGERQIVALLRALQLQPQVLLLDEPTAALDAESARVVEEIVQSYLQESPDTRASVWVTHAMEQVPRVADWQISLRDGRAEEPKRVR